MIKAIHRHSLHAHVVQELGLRIVRGELAAGEVLPPEEVLASQLAVSRTVLREAVKVLAAKGLLEPRPKVGTRVRDWHHWHQLDGEVLAWRCASIPTADFVEKLVEIRQIVEPAAAAAAAKRCTAEQLREIELAANAMAAADNDEEWNVADVAFHRAILQGTGNELLVSLFSVIEASLSMFFELSTRAAKDLKQSLALHQKVFESVRRRQPEAARRATRAIILDSYDSMLAQKGRSQKR